MDKCLSETAEEVSAGPVLEEAAVDELRRMFRGEMLRPGDRCALK